MTKAIGIQVGTATVASLVQSSPLKSGNAIVENLSRRVGILESLAKNLVSKDQVVSALALTEEDSANVVGDVTQDILENSSTEITVIEQSALFTFEGSSAKVFIGAGGIIGGVVNDAGDTDTKFSLDSDSGLLTCEDAIIHGTLQADTIITNDVRLTNGSGTLISLVDQGQLRANTAINGSFDYIKPVYSSTNQVTGPTLSIIGNDVLTPILGNNLAAGDSGKWSTGIVGRVGITTGAIGYIGVLGDGGGNADSFGVGGVGLNAGVYGYAADGNAVGVKAVNEKGGAGVALVVTGKSTFSATATFSGSIVLNGNDISAFSLPELENDSVATTKFQYATQAAPTVWNNIYLRKLSW